ncbi:transmembrane protease serine 11D [Hoplias malabaricus]|uniref:transmembrane protease serine 11D n=1 Tax=Hoplias malabaricus TaxID=27720 RepID=UPI003461E40B
MHLLTLYSILASLMVSGSSDCGVRPLVGPPGGPRILGGHVVQEGAWPWQVSIQWRSIHVCGGAILNHSWILSAAHCFKNSRSTSGLQVVAGLHSRWWHGRSVQIRSVDKVITHENYDKTTYENDVALLRLRYPLSFSSRIQPVCTIQNETEERDLSFRSCFITGWGSSVFEGKLVNTLRAAEVRLIDTETCNQIDWHSGHVTDNMVCAGWEYGGVDTCQGDSGGPLSCYSEVTGKYYIYGVTSHGEECGLPKKPGLYTRISRYTTWLWRTQERSISSATEMKPTDVHVILFLTVFCQSWTFI